ncbi:AmmeMemoRadiSam system protein B [Natronoglycomyces albus]|uniref:MEMO1 family protein JQS30_01720 n=1 Tax=Natronoglycomyces albus TaxID=2811108 RepID=A0A895XK09_9ACTN|nr:AmmeMemoRadiSam system protein B [Natronoglycomyces albus]QSB05674.1 AmmeMemoRadiSam system protein B [Natronoglycomyces albus]
MTDQVRSPVVAGRFYQRSPQRLREHIAELLDSAEGESSGLARAYVVPHAGYVFSGGVAAQVYARLRSHREQISTVVLLGPSHFEPLRGTALSPHRQWETPLGLQRVASLPAELQAALRVDATPHEREHAIEVQIPFIQECLPEVEILPVAVGVSQYIEVADLIARIMDATSGDGATVLLCSTDLSHYHDGATATEIDERTAEAMVDLRPDDISTSDACGVFALRACLEWARREGLRPELLRLTHSGEVSGHHDRVVGYAAMSLR